MLRRYLTMIGTLVLLSTSMVTSSRAADCGIKVSTSDKSFDLRSGNLEAHVVERKNDISVCLTYKNCSWSLPSVVPDQLPFMSDYFGSGSTNCNKRGKSPTEVEVFCTENSDFETRAQNLDRLLFAVQPSKDCAPPFFATGLKSSFLVLPLLDLNSPCVALAVRRSDRMPFTFVLPSCQSENAAALLARDMPFDFSGESKLLIIGNEDWAWSANLDVATQTVGSLDVILGSSDPAKNKLADWWKAVIIGAKSTTPLPAEGLAAPSVGMGSNLARVIQWCLAVVRRLSPRDESDSQHAREWMARAELNQSNSFRGTLLRTDLLQ